VTSEQDQANTEAQLLILDTLQPPAFAAPPPPPTTPAPPPPTIQSIQSIQRKTVRVTLTHTT